MRKNLIILIFALLGALAAAEYNQYSRCHEWRVELALRDQGIAPDRSWGGDAVDFLAGDLIAVGEKWQCGIPIKRGESAWAGIEAVTLVPVIGTAAGWVVRTARIGFARLAVLTREALAARGVTGFVRAPITLFGKITARRVPILVFGGALLAVYFANAHLLLDALALLPWIVQFALWTILLFGLGKCIEYAVRLVLPLVSIWPRFRQRSSTARPIVASPERALS